jgi:hypothetical protein
MSSTDPLEMAHGPGPRAWHCAALRALGLRLVKLAERLDRASSRPLPWEPLVAHLSAQDDHLLDLRHRIYTRYY